MHSDPSTLRVKLRGQSTVLRTTDATTFTRWQMLGIDGLSHGCRDGLERGDGWYSRDLALLCFHEEPKWSIIRPQRVWIEVSNCRRSLFKLDLAHPWLGRTGWRVWRRARGDRWFLSFQLLCWELGLPYFIYKISSNILLFYLIYYSYFT